MRSLAFLLFFKILGILASSEPWWEAVDEFPLECDLEVAKCFTEVADLNPPLRNSELAITLQFNNNAENSQKAHKIIIRYGDTVSQTES